MLDCPKNKDIYKNLFLWHIIYEASKIIIKGRPDKMYPGQILKIPRTGHNMHAIKQGINNVGALRPFTPPQRDNPPIS